MYRRFGKFGITNNYLPFQADFYFERVIIIYPFINLWGFNIPSYGLCMTVAIVLCCFLFINKGNKTGLLFENMIIICAVAIGMGLFCAGLLYIIVTYSLEEICNYIRNGEIDFIKNSGLVFYGGLIGGILGVVISAKLLKVNIQSLEKSIVPYIPLGHSIGRIGCLMAGCCHGFEYSGIFAVKNFLSKDITYFPIQAVESILNIAITLLLLLYTKKERPKYSILCYYFFMYSIMRFSLEFFRGDDIRGAFLTLSTGQWISAFIFSACVIWKCFFSHRKSQTIATNKKI